MCILIYVHSELKQMIASSLPRESFRKLCRLGVVAYACNPSTRETEAGGAQVGGQTGYIVSSRPV
jgi:hypothetical protein